jgi:hypothetical protein
LLNNLHLGIEFIVCRYASISRVDARSFADAFCEAFPVCARWQLADFSERVDAGVVKDALNISGCDGLS